MMNNIDYRNEFQTGAEAYDRIVQSKHISMIYELEKQALIQFFSQIESESKTLLDFACGSGRWTQWLENYFKEVVAVDVSDEMIMLARKKCKQTQFIVTDITSLSVDVALEGVQVDVITAFRFYKNAEETLRLAATQALSRYVKPGGYFIFDIHLNTFSVMGLLAKTVRMFRLPKLLGLSGLVTRTMSLGNIRCLFADSEFEIIDYYGMGLLPGRSNYTLLPSKWLVRLESFFTRHKILRNNAYNLLIIAKRRGGYACKQST